MPTWLITGVTGQDGAYLSQLLIEKGYRVIGMKRRSASSDVVGERLRWLGILDEIELVDADLLDLSSLIRLVQSYQPDEVYNLAAQSFVAESWNQPLLTGQVTGLGAANVLEAVRIARRSASTRPPHRRCSARSRRRSRTRLHRFTQGRPTLSRSSTPTG
jgi:GDPmannose 4,6-dehydratase